MTATNFWALVEDGQITYVTEELPKVWRNIRTMAALDDDELADLAWAGHEKTGFFRVKAEPPKFNSETEVVSGPTFGLRGNEVVATYRTHAKHTIIHRIPAFDFSTETSQIP